MENLKKYIKKYNKLISILFAIIGLVFYFYRSWILVNTIASIIIDESLYIYKGFLFASGKYIPFQDYGPWTNHFPLSFLIPGYIQVLFGPGIRTARYFVLFLGTTSLVALWLVAKRLGGTWLAALVIWAIALNSMWVETFSFWTAQLLVHFLLIWIFVFSLGKNRSNWGILIGGVLAGILGMTRINILPIIGLYIFYIFWENGWKKGLLFVLACSGIFIAINVIYWPNIVRFWASWLPRNLTPFLNEFRLKKSVLNNPINWVKPVYSLSSWLNDPTHPVWKQLQAFYRAVRWSFVPLFAILTSLLLLPKRNSWKSESHYKISVFLIVTYIFSFGIHMWASLSGRSCSFYCIEYYMFFYNLLGLLIFITAFPSLIKKSNIWKSLMIILIVLIILLGINYEYAFENKGQGYLTNLVLTAQFPRIQEGKLMGGFAPFWTVLEAKTNFEYYEFLDSASLIPRALPLVEVFLITFGFAPLAYFLLKRRQKISRNFGSFLLFFIISLGLILSPSDVLGGGRDTFRCEDNVLNSYEIAGKELASVLPNRAKVYLDVKASLILLYTEDIQIFPPQLNRDFSKKSNNNVYNLEELYAFGLWNQILSDKWLDEAEYILIQGKYFNDEWRTKIDLGELILVTTTSPVEVCRGADSEYILLKKADNN